MFGSAGAGFSWQEIAFASGYFFFGYCWPWTAGRSSADSAIIPRVSQGVQSVAGDFQMKN